MLDVKKIQAAINMIAAEKKLPKEKLVEIIEAAIRTAYKKTAILARLALIAPANWLEAPRYLANFKILNTLSSLNARSATNA